MANAFTNQGAAPMTIGDAFKQIFNPPVRKTTGVLPTQPTAKQDPTKYGGVNYVSPTVPMGSKFGSSGTTDYASPQAAAAAKAKTTTGLLPTKPPATTPPSNQYYDKNTGALTPLGRSLGMADVNKKDPVVTPPVASTNPAVQAENVGKAGQQTENEKNTQRQVEESGAVSEWENAVRSGVAVEEANKRLFDLRSAIAKKYAAIESQAIPLEFQQGREQALARQFASQEAAAQAGVSNALLNQQQQFAAAQAQAGRNLSAQQGAFSGAQGIAQRGLGAQQSVLQAGLPGQIAPGIGAYNPLTQQNLPGIGANPFQGGVTQGQVALGQQYAGMSAATQAATGIKNSIQNLLNQVPLNPTVFSDVNKVIQLLSGKVSDPNYQTLSNYLNEYISTLAPILGVGGDTTNLKTEIAQSMINAQASGQSISTVLDNLESLANAKLAAIANAGQGGFQTPGGSTGGGFAETWE